MRMPRILTGIVLACGLTGTVQAATLISGPVYGGPDQDQVACVVVNASTAPITFVTKELLGQFKAPLDQNFDDCGASLKSGGTCSFQAAAVNQAAACKVIILESKTDVRGTMVSYEFSTGVSNAWLSQADLR
jgi:hypothetical protein